MANARLAGGGDRAAWGAGLFALGGFADRVGLTSALSAAVPRRGERAPVHDRGVLLVHLLLVLAGGGEACTDIGHLRWQRELFAAVGSDSTRYRVLRGIDSSGLGSLWGAAARTRERAWSKRRRGEPLVLDIDSTLVEVHSENKLGAAPHYKGGFGFHKLMRKHADVEDAIARIKDSGLARMPFTSWHANRAWAALCTISAALVHWFQTQRLTGPLAKAAPKRLRWQLRCPTQRSSSVS